MKQKKSRLNTLSRYLLILFFSYCLHARLLVLPAYGQDRNPGAGHSNQAFEVGVAWQGKALMQDRVLHGLRKTLSEQAPQIHLEIRKDLPDMTLLKNALADFEQKKQAMVILRSNGARLLGIRGAKIPAFIGGCNDPVALGAAYAYDKPKPNITGVTYSVPARIKLDAFREIYPGMRKFVLLVEKGHPGSPIDALDTEASAENLGLIGRTAYCASLEEACAAVREAGQDEVIIIGAQALLLDNASEIVRTADKRPVFAYSEHAVEHGAIGGIVADDEKLGQMLGMMLIRHLVQGTSVSQMPIETDPEPTLRLNYAALERYDKQIPFAIRSLAKSQQVLERVTISAPTGIGIVNDDRLKMTNRYIRDLTGYNEQELYGQPFRILFSNDSEYRKLCNEMERQLAAFDSGALEAQVMTKSGELRDILLSFTAMDPGSPALGMVFTLQDITERKQAVHNLQQRTQTFLIFALAFICILSVLALTLGRMWRKSRQAEEALRKSEEKYRLLAENSEDMISRHEPDGTIMFVSPSCKSMTGYSVDELIGKQANFLVYPEDVDHVWESLRIQQEKQDHYKVEHRVLRKDGTLIWVEIIGRFIRERSGEIREIQCQIRDITERKRAEEEREKLQAQLTQAQKIESVGRLAGGVAHDFNNMLSVIMGRIELAMMRIGSNEKLRTDLDAIQKAAQRSADLTRQLLAFARKQTISPRMLDLNETMEGMLMMIRRLIGEDIDLYWRPGKNLAHVNVDPGQVDQILVNLCVNARDAIEGVGKVTIETDNVTFNEACCDDLAGFLPGEYVMLMVSDNGCGMDSETLSNIFEPFFTTKELGKGTGLGLATVYGVVKQNNGFINVYSEPERGTTFRIYLPGHRAKAVPRPDPAPAPKSGTESILLVEDEPDILEITTEMLEMEGYTVMGAAKPGEAIKLAHAHPGEIHLLITDVVMPEMNGRDLAKNLLSLFPNMKCLFISGYTADVISQHGMLDEDVNFIQKPFSKKDISIKVREALDGDKA